MKSLSQIKLWQGNPISCDCNTNELIKWLNKIQKISSPGKSRRCKDFFLDQKCSKLKLNSILHKVDDKNSSISVYKSGEKLSLYCNITGYPLPLIVWRHPTEGLFYPYKDGRVKCLRNGTLLISRLNYEDDGRYTCYGLMAEMNAFSSRYYTVKVRKSNSNLTVSPNRIKIQVSLGTKTSISCLVNSKFNGKIKWFSPDNKVIFSQLSTAKNKNINKYEISKKGRLLHINNISKEDVGHYKCVASNRQGVAESLIELDVGSEKDNFLLKVSVACGVVIAIALSGVGAYFVRRARYHNFGQVSSKNATQLNSNSLSHNNSAMDVQNSVQQLEQPYQTEPQVKGFRL